MLSLDSKFAGNRSVDMQGGMTRKHFVRLVATIPAAALGGTLVGCPERTKYTTPKGLKSAVSGGFGVNNHSPKKIGLVTDVAGINDKSFNAMAVVGLERVKSELKLETKIIESRQNGDYVNNLTQLARAGFDVVFAVGFLMRQAIADVAARFPETTFVIIDAESPSLSNCAGIQYREEEGCFLVGALAGLVSKTGVVGFVGGLNVPLIKKFEMAYQAGAIFVRKDIEIRVGYAGSFQDPQKGQEIAQLQISTRADVIFQAAGKTGIGVIKAVSNAGKGRYAIGTDRNQDGDAPGFILTSMIKRVDLAVFDTVNSIVQGSFSAGSTVKGLKESWIALSDFTFTKDVVGEKNLAKVEELRLAILNGTIKPPTTQIQLDAFIKAQ